MLLISGFALFKLVPSPNRILSIISLLVTASRPVFPMFLAIAGFTLQSFAFLLFFMSVRKLFLESCPIVSKDVLRPLTFMIGSLWLFAPEQWSQYELSLLLVRGMVRSSDGLRRSLVLGLCARYLIKEA